MDKLSDDMRMYLAEKAASILVASSTIIHSDFVNFSEYKDQGEGAVVLWALANSNSLPKMTRFRCTRNFSWFSDGKESNIVLLSDAIRAMTSLEYLNLAGSWFYSQAMCDKVVNAIVANQDQNPNLKDINLYWIGGPNNHRLSFTSIQLIEALKVKGLNIAQTKEQWQEMNERYHPEEQISTTTEEEDMQTCD